MYYKIYANGLRGWEYITSTYKEDSIEEIISKLETEIYSRALVIQHDIKKQEDSVYMSEYIEEVKTRRRKI